MADECRRVDCALGAARAPGLAQQKTRLHFFRESLNAEEVQRVFLDRINPIREVNSAER